MLNGLFVVVTLVSILMAAASGQMEALTAAILSSARGAVDLAIGLIGVMAFFLGLMKVAEDAGLMTHVARAVSPVMRLIFPSVPAGSPAMSAMILNISANMLGLANAATPFGIKAIEELDKLNSRPGTATNAMVRFLAINTAGLAILPSGIIGVRAALGSADAAGIFFPTWFASGSATVVAVSAAILLGRLPRYRDSEPPPVTPSSDAGDAPHVEAALPKTLPVVPLRRWIGWGFWVVFAALAARNVAGRLGAETPLEIARNVTSFWILSAIIATGVLYGWVRGVRVYDSLVAGAKEGFQVAIRIIPYLVAILVAVGMFRASGGLELIVGVLSPVTALIGMPAEALPMAILRPLTGSGALGVAAEAMTANGPDSLVGYLVSTYQGSTETTFYVIAVYYGAIGVRNTRHTVPSCLMADVTGILAATFIVNLFFG